MEGTRRKRSALARRARRVRKRVTGTAERPRLAVRRSLAQIYAQIVDDMTGHVLAAASSLTPELRAGLKSAGKAEAAKAVGKQIAAVALSRGIKKVCFDRGGRKYHGRVKALAEAAREAGLVF
jgi:large subunit ribosomal protein L18